MLALPVVWQLKTQDNFYGQNRLLNKGKSNCQSQPLGAANLQHVLEMELMVVRIVALAMYKVSTSSLADSESGDVSYIGDSSLSCTCWLALYGSLLSCFSYLNISVIRIPSGPNVFR